jgi:hypothetical protein
MNDATRPIKPSPRSPHGDGASPIAKSDGWCIGFGNSRPGPTGRSSRRCSERTRELFSAQNATMPTPRRWTTSRPVTPDRICITRSPETGAKAAAGLFFLADLGGVVVKAGGQQISAVSRWQNTSRNGMILQPFWRRGWDSNPRATFAAAGFQDRCLQPLGHPSDRLCESRSFYSAGLPRVCK